MDPSIRFVGIISYEGRLLESRIRKGTRLLVGEKDQEMFFMESALKWRMRNEFDNKLGPVNFTMVERKNVVMMGFPFENNILCVSADILGNIFELPKKVMKTLIPPM